MKKNVKILEDMLEREKRIKLICAELNRFVDLKSRLNIVIKHIKALVGCEAVSIRLYSEGDYPYFVYDGFTSSFIRHETSILGRNDDGTAASSLDGEEPPLECVCGSVIRGVFEPDLPFISNFGSFFTNSTTALLTDRSLTVCLGRTRNYCNWSGYESVALVPLKSEGKNIGLIQLNDKLRDIFTEEKLEVLEMIAEQVALAVQNSFIYAKLQDSLKEIKTLNRKLEIAAKTDPLTGLINRKAFLAVADYEKKRFSRSKKPFSIIMCDIDHFKSINDSMGHEAGDYVLVQTSELLKKSVRQQDTVCRWGGEEFIILLPETDRLGGKKLADKLRSTVESKEYYFKSYRIKITMSFGITFCEDNVTVYSYIKEADELMYKAKRSGRNTVVADHNEAMDTV
jgi:diguanylate cyclase (GGDEF)-like protein